MKTIAKKSFLDLIIRKTAVQTMISESVVDEIIRDQWKQANKQTQLAREIEITGLGIFKVSQVKIRKELRILYYKLKNCQKRFNDEQDIVKKKKIEARLDSLNVSIKLVESKKVEDE